MKNFPRNKKLPHKLALAVIILSILFVISLAAMFASGLIYFTQPPPEVTVDRFERNPDNTNVTLTIKNNFSTELTIVRIDVDAHRNGRYVETIMSPLTVTIEPNGQETVVLNLKDYFSSFGYSKFMLKTDSGYQYECLTQIP